MLFYVNVLFDMYHCLRSISLNDWEILIITYIKSISRNLVPIIQNIAHYCQTCFVLSVEAIQILSINRISLRFKINLST